MQVGQLQAWLHQVYQRPQRVPNQLPIQGQPQCPNLPRQHHLLTVGLASHNFQEKETFIFFRGMYVLCTEISEYFLVSFSIIYVMCTAAQVCTDVCVLQSRCTSCYMLSSLWLHRSIWKIILILSLRMIQTCIMEPLTNICTVQCIHSKCKNCISNICQNNHSYCDKNHTKPKIPETFRFIYGLASRH